MTQTVTLINISTDTWQTVINKVNELANLSSNTFVTANSNANGSITTGNAYGNGIFTFTTLTAESELRGGNVQTATILTVTSNVIIATGNNLTIGNSTVNTFLGGTTLSMGNTTVNATVNTTYLSLGSAAVNVSISESALYFGNTTVNTVANTTYFKIGSATDSAVLDSASLNLTTAGDDAVVNTTFFYFGGATTNATMNTTSLSLGNTTVNAFVNTTVFQLANSTVTFNFTKPTAAEAAAGSYFLNSGGNWSQIGAAVETPTTGTTAQLIANFTFADYYAGELHIAVNDENANNRLTTKLLVVHDEGDAYYSEYALIESNSAMGTFAANANSTHVRVYFTPVSTSTTVKVRSELIEK